MLNKVSVFCVTVMACLVGSQETTPADTLTSSEDSVNKTECIDIMLKWCKNMQYPQEGAGMSMLSVTYEDKTGYYRVFCNSDFEGTNCTRNGNTWFGCTSNHTLLYKNKVVSSDGSDVDDDICSTADTAFHELFVQNLGYDNSTLRTTVEKGMESFFEQIAEMQEQIERIQRVLRDAFWSIGGGEVTDMNGILHK